MNLALRETVASPPDSSRTLANASQSRPAQGNWLNEVSTVPQMSIGQVVNKLSTEFPSVQGSKLRYMEELGIIHPQRASNGYRRYSQADVEKIRFALSRQRDSYMPWSKIRSEIEILEAGGAPPEAEPTARIVASQGVRKVPEVGKRLSVRQLLDYSGASAQQLEQLVNAGLLSPDLSGRFSPRALPVLIAYLSLEQHGIQARNLRSIRSATNAAVDLVEQVVAPTQGRNFAADKERARAQAAVLGANLNVLVAELLAIGIENIT